MKTEDMKKIFLCVFMAAALVSVSNAQSYHLTLEESIDLAKEKSLRMQRLIHDMDIAEYNLKATISRYRTHIDLTLRAPDYDESVRTWEDSTGISFYPVRVLKAFGGITINQPLPTDGRIYIETGLDNTIDYYTRVKSANFNTRIGLTQPLDAFWGYNAYKSSIKRARLAFEQSNKSLHRAELNLIYDVSSAYYNLLSLQKSTEIALLDLERQTEANEISKKKYEAGLLREVDALQMEVDLAEAQNNYEIAMLNEVSATNLFKELLGIGLQDEVTLSSDFSYTVVDVDPEKAVALALENRLEMRESDINIELQELSLKQQKSEGQPKALLTGYFEKRGVSRERFGTSYSSLLSNSFSDYGNRPSSYGVGLTISIPILDWGENRNSVRAAQTRLRQNLIQKEETHRSIETEVRNLVAGIHNNLRRLQLLEKNVEVAEKSFEITLNRFSEGDIDSQTLALERTRLNTAYTSHLRAYINYQLSLADLMRKTFYDFQNDRMANQ